VRNDVVQLPGDARPLVRDGLARPGVALTFQIDGAALEQVLALHASPDAPPGEERPGERHGEKRGVGETEGLRRIGNRHNQRDTNHGHVRRRVPPAGVATSRVDRQHVADEEHARVAQLVQPETGTEHESDARQERHTCPPPTPRKTAREQQRDRDGLRALPAIALIGGDLQQKQRRAHGGEKDIAEAVNERARRHSPTVVANARPGHRPRVRFTGARDRL
jgi:hypothetical protein